MIPTIDSFTHKNVIWIKQKHQTHEQSEEGGNGVSPKPQEDNNDDS
jgi:hypothetical protein